MACAAGLFYRKCGLDRLRFGVYPALLGSMLSGRAVYALALTAAATLFGLENLSAHMAVQAAVTGLSGIAVQIVVLPPLVKLFEKSTFAHQSDCALTKTLCCAKRRSSCKAKGCTLACRVRRRRALHIRRQGRASAARMHRPLRRRAARRGGGRPRNGPCCCAA